MSSKKIKVFMEDKGGEGAIYGVMSGNINFIETGEPDGGTVKIETEFIPYDKYKDHQYLKKNELYWVWIKR